jgi:hypothetical protein
MLKRLVAELAETIDSYLDARQLQRFRQLPHEPAHRAGHGDGQPGLRVARELPFHVEAALAPVVRHREVGHALAAPHGGRDAEGTPPSSEGQGREETLLTLAPRVPNPIVFLFQAQLQIF